uniref:Immunoglobulin V-set domain-containing protein n=1 Tax=Oryzias melastigma TaxID=30732 RepID=A0A3B3CHM6_ORYME
MVSKAALRSNRNRIEIGPFSEANSKSLVTLTSFTGLKFLFYISGLISFSLSEFHTVKVQLEGEVTLQCSNFSTLIVHIIWFKLNDGPNATVISSMFTADVNAMIKNGFKDRFLMTSNITHVFLNIKNVNSFDSGLYFCGNNKDGILYCCPFCVEVPSCIRSVTVSYLLFKTSAKRDQKLLYQIGLLTQNVFLFPEPHAPLSNVQNNLLITLLSNKPTTKNF